MNLNTWIHEGSHEVIHSKIEDQQRRILLVGVFVSSSIAVHNVGEALSEKLSEAGWGVHTTSRHTSRLWRLLDMVTTTWRQRSHYTVAQVDVFSGLAFGWAEAVCFLLQRAGKPFVLSLRGGNLPVFSHRWPWRVKRLLQSATLVTAPSRFLQEEMRPYRADILTIPNPINLNAYAFRQRRLVHPRLVWLRSFHAIYNPSLAPKMLALLVPHVPDIRLIMVGQDKGDGSLQNAHDVAQKLGVVDRIEWPGGISKTEVPNWLNKGDIFLNTTNIDNTPVSVLEAMACGLCIVSTNVGGIPYLLKHEHDALLVPPDDTVAMAHAVRRILEDPGLAERLSRNARKTASQFDWSNVFPIWERVLMTAVT
ncbi:MAG: glycosyltransferase family 4 protein [Rhodothermales bacterium]